VEERIGEEVWKDERQTRIMGPSICSSRQWHWSCYFHYGLCCDLQSSYTVGVFICSSDGFCVGGAVGKKYHR
jgi:hypothetical protein